MKKRNKIILAGLLFFIFTIFISTSVVMRKEGGNMGILKDLARGFSLKREYVITPEEVMFGSFSTRLGIDYDVVVVKDTDGSIWVLQTRGIPDKLDRIAVGNKMLIKRDRGQEGMGDPFYITDVQLLK